jgi:hypothetical protein
VFLVEVSLRNDGTQGFALHARALSVRGHLFVKRADYCESHLSYSHASIYARLLGVLISY